METKALSNGCAKFWLNINRRILIAVMSISRCLMAEMPAWENGF